MAGYLETGNTKLCCGCGGCADTCAQNAISMIPNAEGFLYPSIDLTKCLQCGECIRACPYYDSNADMLPNGKSDAFALQLCDEKILLDSTSGGAFSAICMAAGEDTLFAGAVYDENLSVLHELVGAGDLPRLRKSKYVQSDMNGCFSKVKDALENGQKVVFAGVSCQVGGLRSFLQHEYDGLTTVDIVCHGVASPMFYRKYLDYMSKKHGAPLESIDFRCKSTGEWEKSRFRITFRDGGEYSEIYNNAKDPYMKAFLSRICLRESCYQCPYRGINRCSDLTISDFWGAWRIFPDDETVQGMSCILANTDRGRNLIDSIMKQKIADVFPVRFEEDAKPYNNYMPDASGLEARAGFFEKFAAGDMDALINEYIIPYQFKDRIAISDEEKARIRRELNLQYGK